MSKMDSFLRTMMWKAHNKGIVALELNDIEDTSVSFNVVEAGEIAVGTEASPDGVYKFADGRTITIEGGVVTKIEVEEKVEETEVVEEAKAEEEIEGPATEELEGKIAELEAIIAEKDAFIAELQGKLDDQEKEIDKINNLVVSMGAVNEHKERKQASSVVENVDSRILFKRNK